jgi:ABC-2 type transport system permease protein
MKKIFSEESVFEQLRRSLAIAKKDIRIYYNKGPVVIQGILFPIMLFLAFTVGRDIPPIYMISGLMSMVLFLTSTSIGPVVFPWETRQKTLERLITCPISIKTILLGSLWGSFVFGCVFSIVPLMLGIVFYGLLATMNPFIVFTAIILGALSFSSFGLILSAPPTSTPASTMTLTVLIKFPVVFISPLFTQIKVNIITLISPLSYFIDLINIGLGKPSGFGSSGLLIDVLFLALFGLCSLGLAFFLHGKTLQKRFKG